ncbi:glycosyltransferase involved in cell wall biosynthesis [Skermanella aerolata]|uniref:glycosyltransferase n=1 Tax=Skermanella aerolata TaxID=393310 RepID=UPI003D1F3C02
MPKIAAVICTYDRYDVLEKAIDSLRQQTLSKDIYEVIVIDNLPSTQNFKHYSELFHNKDNIRYMAEPMAGLSSARNRGLAECRSDIIAYMDDDAIAANTWLAEILTAFELYGDAAGIVGGRVRPIWDVPRPPWLDDTMLGHLSVVDWGGENARIAESAEWFAGTNISYRAALLREHGGFTLGLGRNGQTASLLGNEEIAVTNSIRDAGYLAIYAPDVVVDHLVPLSRLNRGWFRKRAAWQAVSDFLMQDHAADANALEAWEGLVKYISSLPPEERSLRGLFHATDKSDQFRWQTSTVYDMTRILLSKFELPE